MNAKKQNNKPRRPAPRRQPVATKSNPPNSNLSSLRRAKTAAASAYSVRLSTAEPKITGAYRSTRIRHRELITSVTGSTTFTAANTFSINPGLVASFPWLSTQAAGWEQYKFHKLKYCYYTRCATSVPGSVLLVPDYDAADTAPLTEQIASSYRDVVEEVPWVEEFSCVLDPAAMAEPANRKYIRTGPLASNLDVKTYDAGNLFLCTVDGTAVNWGKLWVEYDVELFVPQLPPSGLANNSGSLVNSSGTGVASALALGTAASTVALGGIAISAAANVLTLTGLVAGVEYLAAGQVAGTTSSGYSFTATTGLTAISSQISFASAQTTDSLGTQTSAQLSTFRATASTATITLVLSAIGTPVHSSFLFCPLPGGISGI